MSRPSSALLVALSVLALSACAARQIPGSDIKDTKDTRAILEVLEQYQAALQQKDAPAVLALVSPSYRDDLGNTNPSDDMTYATLQKQLPEQLERLSDVNVSISVREIEVNRNEAFAVFYYDSSYRVSRIRDPQRSDSDLARMTFRREDGQWKITKGL